jgi:hypothetical protein
MSNGPGSWALTNSRLVQARLWLGCGIVKGLCRLAGAIVCGLVLQPLPLAWSESPEPAPSAREVVKSGTVEAGLDIGYWQAVTFIGSAPSADRSAVFVMPRIGMVVTDEIQANLLSGNVELLLEPLYGRFTQPFAADAAGGSMVIKYNLLSFGRWMPFWDAGAGMLWTNLAPRIPEQSTPFNFILETGPGAHYFLTRTMTVTVGVRYHHISNADIGQRNTGLNAVLPYVGVSWFLPR